MMSSDHIIKQTKYWISSFIINYTICPFARNPFTQDTIYYTVVDSRSIEECLYAVFSECERLDNTSDIETTFLIYPNLFQDFNDYLDFLTLAENLLNIHNYDGIYQIASFHPMYCFDNEDEIEATSYTNRSPYPMLHLIRETSISKALASFPHPEQIPKNNIALTKKLGANKLQTILEQAMNKLF